MSAADASSFTSASAAMVYMSPFVGGILADGMFGDYWGILFGTSFFYLPGLIIIAVCGYPYLLGDTFV